MFMESIQVQPIAIVHNNRDDMRDDFWGGVKSEIRFADHISAAALDGIEEFSHLDIIFYFHKLGASAPAGKARPRGNPAWPEVGIFAQRKKRRPNALGLTTARLIDRAGRTLIVDGLDADDGTPILDVKPALREFQPAEPIRQPQWASELMRDYWRSSEQ